MHRAPQPRRRYVGYHLMVALLLGGVVFLAACDGDDAAPAPMGPSVDEVTPAPEPSPAPEPIPPAEEDPAPASPAANPEPEVEVVEDEPEPVNNGEIRDGVGVEDCVTANTTTPMTQAEWIEFCSPSLDADEAHTDGGDGWPEGAYEPAPDECIGYGCSPEQDAAILEAERLANEGY